MPAAVAGIDLDPPAVLVIVPQHDADAHVSAPRMDPSGNLPSGRPARLAAAAKPARSARRRGVEEYRHGTVVHPTGFHFSRRTHKEIGTQPTCFTPKH